MSDLTRRSLIASGAASLAAANSSMARPGFWIPAAPMSRWKTGTAGRSTASSWN